jgi:hypothetical protein
MRRASPISSALPGRFVPTWMTGVALAAIALLLVPSRATAQGTDPPLRIITAPALPQIALVGETLTPTSGSWEGPMEAMASYEWLRCDESGNACAPLASGTAQPAPHLVTADDAGHALLVRLTVSVGSNAMFADSNPVLVPRAPSNTAPPVIEGTARDGALLMASRGEWIGTPPLSFDYQWQRCAPSGASCHAVPGATRPSYLLSGADAGLTVRVRVTASNAAGTSAADSAPTAVVAPAPLANLERPAIVGAAEVDRSLTALPGRWTPSGGIEFLYRWLRCNPDGSKCDAISGATERTYQVRVADVGSRLGVRVTAIADAGSSMAESALTPVVPAPPGTQGFSQLGTAPRTMPAEPTFMRPFPRVRIKGFYTATGARVQLFTVKGPVGARIRISCRGESCPFRRRNVQSRPRIRLRSLERFHPAGTRIVIRVTSARLIGKYTRIVIRAGRMPARRDRCLLPDATRPVRCPLPDG